MPDITLHSSALTVGINLHGAEVRSIIQNATGKEYLWQADPTFWGRSSPVLFPFVGAVNEKTFRVDGKPYPMGQHGFARDMDFTLVENSDTEALFCLESSEETMAKYPFPFALFIGYQLNGSCLRVCWRITNPGEGDLPFSIGAHPAFNCPFAEEDGYALMVYDTVGAPLEHFVRKPFSGGLAGGEYLPMEMPGGRIELNAHTFDIDTYILENHQAGSAELIAPGGKVVRVEFTSPLVGLWSPPGKNAPFVCIEPWYGRADEAGYTGELKDRAWGNILPTGEEFCAEYTMTFY